MFNPTGTNERRCLLTECEVTGWEARCKERGRKCCSASGSVGMWAKTCVYKRRTGREMKAFCWLKACGKRQASTGIPVLCLKQLLDKRASRQRGWRSLQRTVVFLYRRLWQQEQKNWVVNALRSGKYARGKEKQHVLYKTLTFHESSNL